MAQTYTVVGASASPLFSEKPNLVRSAILRSAINGWPVVPTLVDAMMSGFNIYPRKAINFGAGDYYRGQLIARNVGALVNWPYVHSFVASLHNKAVSSITVIENKYTFSAESSTYANWYEWEEVLRYSPQYMYDPVTDLTAGLPYIPAGYVAQVFDVVEVRGPDDGREAGEQSFDVMYYAYDPKDRAGTELVRTYSFPSEFGREKPRPYRVVVAYDVEGVPRRQYFSYIPGLGTYPVFDADFADSVKSTYYPVMHLMTHYEGHGQRWVGDNPYDSVEENKKELADTEKMLKYSGITLENIKKSLEESPDFSSVSRSFIMYGVVLSENQSMDKDVAKYMYKYLEFIIDTYTPPTEAEFLEGNGNVLFSKTKQLRFQETIPSSLYLKLEWDYIEKKSILYESTKAGKYGFSKVINYTENYNPAELQDALVGKPSHVYFWYHDKATRKGYKIEIGNLSGEMATNFLNPNQTPKFTLRMAYPLPSEDAVSGIIFPLSSDIMNVLSKREYTSVAMSGLTLINQAILQVKLKWYERDDFKLTILIAAIVVSVITMNPGFIAAAEAGLGALALYILESVAIGYLLSSAIGYVLGMLADAIGGEAALILAAVVTAVGVAYGFGVGVDLDVGFAGDLIKLATLMLEKVNLLTQTEFSDLQQEMREYTADYKETLASIEEANDLLGDVGLDFNVGRAGGIIMGESASDFYSRTLGTGEYNDLSLEAVSSYVANKLTLPSFASSSLVY